MPYLWRGDDNLFDIESLVCHIVHLEKHPRAFRSRTTVVHFFLPARLKIQGYRENFLHRILHS